MDQAKLLLNPRDIDLGPTSRTDYGITPEFLATIKERGVVCPIEVELEAGRYVCTDGNRRLIAAKILGLSFIVARTSPFDY